MACTKILRLVLTADLCPRPDLVRAMHNHDSKSVTKHMIVKKKTLNGGASSKKQSPAKKAPTRSEYPPLPPSPAISTAPVLEPPQHAVNISILEASSPTRKLITTDPDPTDKPIHQSSEPLNEVVFENDELENIVGLRGNYCLNMYLTLLIIN